MEKWVFQHERRENMARITYTYRHYPLSEELTEKSKNVAFFTRPLLGFGLGAILWFVPSMAFNVSVSVSNVLMVIGMVGGPIALQIIRAKKFAQYDAEYAKILKEQEKKNTTNKKPVVQQKPAYQQPVQQQPVQQQPVQQQPVQQQPVYQQPVQQQPVYQQPVYQQPVYQQPVYQQPVYQQPVYNTAGSGMQTLDEQIDEICKIANANLSAQNDPQIHWECAQKLEQMLQVHPDNERLQREVAQNLANYSWNSTGKPFAERRRAYNAALRSLTLEKKKREMEELDNRKFILIIHAVNGGQDAAWLDDVNALEEARQWLRTAATYKMEAPDAERQQYQNVAIPSVHFHVGYWLAKTYLAQTPPQKQKAKAVIEEALQVCPYALVRKCDVCPRANTDTSTVNSREQLMSLLQLASQ